MEKKLLTPNLEESKEVNIEDEPTDFSVMDQYGYTLLNKLGTGSCAKVYRAERHMQGGNEEMACKVIDMKTPCHGYKEVHLRRELEIIRQCAHPSIIKFHSMVKHELRYFIFMEYAANGDLTDLILTKGAVGEAQAQVWFRQIAAGIQYLHSKDVCHRDMKCENVLITAEMNVKITDFGCARFLTDKNGKSMASSTYCGSLLYMAPEVVRHAPYYPKSADVWSLGVILYITTNAAFPFRAANAKELYELQMKRQWAFNPAIADSLSGKLKDLIYRLLQPNTFKRPKIEAVMTDDWVTPMKPKTEPPTVPKKARPHTRQGSAKPKLFVSSKRQMTS